MSDSYETAHDIEARLNRLCGDGMSDAIGDQNDSSARDACSHDDEGLMLDPAISQMTVRSQESDSGTTIDTLTGNFRCSFEPSQTLYVLHIPIYPPMKFAPEVEVVCDQDSVVARTTQAKKFGLRIELKRSSDSELIETVLVEVTASSEA